MAVPSTYRDSHRAHVARTSKQAASAEESRAKLLRAARFRAAQLGVPGAQEQLATLTTNQLKNALDTMNSLGT